MDANQFDELVSRLVDGSNRRDALKGIAGGALATGGLGASLLAAEGKKRKSGKSKASAEGKHQGKCNSPNKKRCGGTCRLITTNKRCGKCSNRCAADEECVNKVCTPLT